MIQGNKQDNDEPVEQYILKKNKLSIDTYYAKQNKYMGYKPSDFRKLNQYKLEATRMPNMSNNFEEAKKIVIPQYHAISNTEGLEKMR